MKIFLGNSRNDWENAISDIAEVYIKSRISIDNLHNFDRRKYIAFPVYTRNDTVTHFLSSNNRHAKPYFFKILKVNQQYIPYIFYFPSEYVYGINNVYNYQVNESQETNNFIESCNLLNSKFKKFGFREVNL